MTDTGHAHIYRLRWSLTNFLSRLALNHDPPE
jgi:hypothetical protein